MKNGNIFLGRLCLGSRILKFSFLLKELFRASLKTRLMMHLQSACTYPAKCNVHYGSVNELTAKITECNPITSLDSPEGSRRLRLSDFKTNGT
jgi:hypothetical protein